MASPSPIAVVKLREKIDTCVNEARIRRTRNVPMMASTPIPIGSPAATTLPKMSTSSSSVMGTLIISAFRRSFSTCELTWRKTSARPPTPTVIV